MPRHHSPTEEITTARLDNPLVSALAVREHMILRLAATPYRSPGRRLDDALELTGLRPTPFWAAVDRLLDRPDALEAYPTEVHRLRRLRERRRAARRPRMQQ